MSPLTTDPDDPRLTHGVDEAPTTMADAYLVTDPNPWPRVRPLRDAYRHTVCGAVTRMGAGIAETYARRPHFYGATWCSRCSMHRPVGKHGEFEWEPGVGETEVPEAQRMVGT